MSISSSQSPGIRKASDRPSTDEVTVAMKSLVRPASGNVGCSEAISVALSLPGARLVELRSVPGGVDGQRLMAFRYLIENGAVWLKYFAWDKPLIKLDEAAPQRTRELVSKIEAAKSKVANETSFAKRIAGYKLSRIAAKLGTDFAEKDSLRILVGLNLHASVRRSLRERLCSEAVSLLKEDPGAVDLLYLASQDLTRYPATTVGRGDLGYVIVADKGEMGVRAVREAIALGAKPVVVFNEQDDSDSLQVRLAELADGFAIALTGNFRETYANADQMASKIERAYEERFGENAEQELARSALYPGYGPLAENTGAIETFRRSGIAFVGPTQDVVEQAGDKRKFRALAEAIDPEAVTPGIVMNDDREERIIAAIAEGFAQNKFTFPGRLKAANGGGGRGQVVIQTPEEVPAAVTKVLCEIQMNGWDKGVMFEQNIFETIHLEVQVIRDRFGNTRHFGMRDCSEQRASQKIQEEAPPALLRKKPELAKKMCDIAVHIADDVGYVGACTVELMFKDGHFYLLEMNTRIQVEHPVTEEAHRIRRGDKLTPLNLVALQFKIAQGHVIDFAQEDVVQTHVAREFRINAESYKADVKDPRDGKKGLFLPNAGVFDVIDVPEAAQVHTALVDKGVEGIDELFVRFDCGFEEGDDLINKDPTFGKLIVSLSATTGSQDRRYELLRLASLEVLARVNIEGRQLLPNGKILEDRPFETNVADHIRVLDTEMLKRHSESEAKGRHVNWLIEMLRAEDAAN